MYDTYDSSNINFVALSDMDVTGTWTLDGDETKTGTFTKTKSIPVELTNISDGDHTINIYGKNENGDGFNESFVFNVIQLLQLYFLNHQLMAQVLMKMEH